ncbi:MAG: hypothetical protein OSB34_16550 [Planktomarina sp.]|nr:hypothetical protein [Planktomarina sp.]
MKFLSCLFGGKQKQVADTISLEAVRGVGARQNTLTGGKKTKESVDKKQAAAKAKRQRAWKKEQAGMAKRKAQKENLTPNFGRDRNASMTGDDYVDITENLHLSDDRLLNDGVQRPRRKPRIGR